MTNTLLHCKKCSHLITSGNNLENLKSNQNLGDMQNVNKINLLFIKNLKEVTAYEVERLPYLLNTVDKIILCKNCNTIIGKYSINENFMIGHLNPEAINEKKIRISYKTSHKIKFLDKNELDNISLLHKVKTMNESINSFSKDLYRYELIDTAQLLEKVKTKLKGVEKILNNNDIH